MTHYLAIGATAESDVTPCYSLDDWSALLSAMEAGDSEAIERITLGARPHYLATASLKTVEPPSLKETADKYWTRRGRTPKARAVDPASGAPIVLEVRR